MTPRRLEAESIRDAILAASGRLDSRMGGPGYNIWEKNTNYVAVYKPRAELGPDAFRRMVYQFKPRSQPDPTFGAFDCPDAALVAPRRNVSTTALQALNLLNSRFVIQPGRLLRRAPRGRGRPRPRPPGRPRLSPGLRPRAFSHRARRRRRLDQLPRRTPPSAGRCTMPMSSSTFRDAGIRKRRWRVVETDTMGIVLVTALIENNDDVKAAEKGLIPEAEVRRIEVHDARVDTGATLCLDAQATDRAIGPQEDQDGRRPRPCQARCRSASMSR